MQGGKFSECLIWQIDDIGEFLIGQFKYCMSYRWVYVLVDIRLTLEQRQLPEMPCSQQQIEQMFPHQIVPHGSSSDTQLFQT